MSRIAQWCYRHRFLVIGLWLVALVGGFSAAQALGPRYTDSFSLPGTDSTRALDLLKTVTFSATGDTDTVVWHVTHGSVKDANVQNRIKPMLQKLSAIAQVGSVDSPYIPENAAQISADGKTAYANVIFTADSLNVKADNVNKVIATAQAAANSAVEVELGGQAVTQVEQPSPSSTVLIAVIAAGIVLFVAFGSLYATAVPIVTALMGLGVGTSAVSLLSRGLSISSFAPTLGTLIGLGIGIDYALFIITRYTTGLKAGLDPEMAAVTALNTAGRAVLFAGTTVGVALLGLLSLRISFLGGVGIAAATIVLTSMLAACTLLPSLFGVLKMRVLSRKQRLNLQTSGPHKAPSSAGIWMRNAAFVQKHPIELAILAVAVICVLCVPFFSMRLGTSDSGNDATSSTTRKAYDLLSAGFGPGFNGPLLLVAKVDSPDKQAAFAKVATNVEHTRGVAAVATAPLSPQSTVGTIQVIPTTSPESKATTDLITLLRNRVLPQASSGSGLRTYVGGVTATFDDFSSVIASKLPLFLLIIISFGFVILMIAFRSIVIPLTAALMNILAAGASFGVLVAVFQYGWGASLLQTGGAGPIDAYVPVMMLAILFGLSMDYQVFLVSRIHEAWVHTGDNDQAVLIGQAETARVITAAATIMILVFSLFMFLNQRLVSEFGLGLATSVFIDAFILRNLLVPAVMHLLERSNWWLPSWLDRILPRVSVEPETLR